MCGGFRLRRHLARRVSRADAAVLLRPLVPPSSVTEAPGGGDCSFLFLSPSPSLLGLLYSWPREAAELGPAVSGPPLPTVPSLRQPPAPAREGTRVCQARGGRGGLGEGGARSSGAEASKLRLPASGRWALCETGPLAGGACGRRRLPSDRSRAAALPRPAQPLPPLCPGAATARASELVPAARCRRPQGLARPARRAAGLERSSHPQHPPRLTSPHLASPGCRLPSPCPS